MKQHRIVTRSYAEDHIPEAYMPADDLAQIKRLAGLGTGLLEDFAAPTPEAEMGEPLTTSPVGSDSHMSMSEKRRIEKDLNIKTGTPEWFRLYFARPELTGEKPVGDEKPDAEENPSYLLDTNGNADANKVSALADKLDKQYRDS